MNALAEILGFIGMALGALGGHELGGGTDLVRIAVAGLAGHIDRAMNAGGRVRGFVGVAGRAFDLRNFGGMGKILDGCVAIGASQNAVDAGGVFGGI